jgi:hypothetical protein
LEHVDDIRQELRRFQEDPFDEIDSNSTSWIGGFLTGLITILRTAYETVVESAATLESASSPAKSKPEQPAIIAEGQADG